MAMAAMAAPGGGGKQSVVSVASGGTGGMPGGGGGAGGAAYSAPDAAAAAKGLADAAAGPVQRKLRVVRAMHAHAQQAYSGDMTLESARRAVRELAAEAADERFVVLVSDANLEQYGITPRELGKLLTLDPEVRVFIIFIGTLEGQAEKYLGGGGGGGGGDEPELPPGHVFLCLNTRDLPKILQKIFASTLL
jgi:hypothetical protein